MESLQFHIKKYDDVQKLLTNTKEEKLELEKNYQNNIESLKTTFSEKEKSILKNHTQQLSKKDIFNKILFVVIGLLLVYIIIQAQIITINF